MKKFDCANCGHTLEGTTHADCPVCNEKYEIEKNGKVRMKG